MSAFDDMRGAFDGLSDDDELGVVEGFVDAMRKVEESVAELDARVSAIERSLWMQSKVDDYIAGRLGGAGEEPDDE